MNSSDGTAKLEVRFREALASIPSYRAGKRPVPIDGVSAYKVSSNENPYPPLPKVEQVIASSASHVNRYPDPGNMELINAISEHLGVPDSDVAVSVGAVGLCYQLAAAVAGVGDEVMFAWRSFEAYPIVAQVAGAATVAVPLTPDGRHDLDSMADAITDRTRLIFVCSPNNPTGAVVGRGEFENFMSRVPRDVLVVLDEAYTEFDRSVDAGHGVETYSRHPNLVVLRTFSKAYGLAGLRVGYAVAHRQVIEALNKVAIPFCVNSVASDAAVASLADHVELNLRVDELVQEREATTLALSKRGVDVQGLGSPGESQANFLWFPFGDDSARIAAELESRGLTVRLFEREGIRVTIAESEANQRLVELLGGLL